MEKSRKHGSCDWHVLMVYLAVLDTLVCCVFALEAITSVTRLLSSSEGYWNTLCIVTDYLTMTTLEPSLLFCTMLSVDR